MSLTFIGTCTWCHWRSCTRQRQRRMVSEPRAGRASHRAWQAGAARNLSRHRSDPSLNQRVQRQHLDGRHGATLCLLTNDCPWRVQSAFKEFKTSAAATSIPVVAACTGTIVPRGIVRDAKIRAAHVVGRQSIVGCCGRDGWLEHGIAAVGISKMVHQRFTGDQTGPHRSACGQAAHDACTHA